MRLNAIDVLICLKGEIINEKDRCKVCVGKKVTKETKIVEVHVDKGMKHEQKIVLRGEGNQMVRGFLRYNYTRSDALHLTMLL